MADNNFTGYKIAIRENYLSKFSNYQDLNVSVLAGGTTLKEFVNGVGKVHAITLVAIMIRNFCSQFNVSKNMSQSQIEDYAADLVLDYMDARGTISWKFEEYAIFFDRAGKGEFRKPNGNSFIFDRIDREVIEEIFTAYLKERDLARWRIEDEIETNKRNGQLVYSRTSKNDFEYDDKGVGHVKSPTIWDLKTQTEKRADSDPLKALEAKYGE